MALLHPSHFPDLREDGGLYRELDVLERLRLGLPDGYEAFHEITWHNVHEGRDRHGEIDIVVLSPTGGLLLMEVKAGDAILREGGIFKRYGNSERDVIRQCRVQYAAMVSRLKDAGLHPSVVNCLALPDYHLPDGEVVSIPRERIISADDFDEISVRVLEMLRDGEGCSDVDGLRRFLCSEFRVSPDVSVLRDQLKGATLRLSDGLATWVPRISHPSGVLRIRATAGSGKTQLALRLLEDAASSGERALYVCFNRTLADSIASLAPARVEVASFHEIAVEHHRRSRGEPDFSNPKIFDEIAAIYHGDSEHFEPKYDLLVIDEGQDFDPQWVVSLLPLLNSGGKLHLLEDESQRLYDREEYDLADAVTISCSDNHRSPREICRVINALGLVSPPVVARSPYAGEVPEFRVYEDEKQLLRETGTALENLAKQGFSPEDIVLLSFHGHNRSKMMKMDGIGGLGIRRFSGEYDRNGNPVWCEGNLRAESVYRFKGQSAPAVVFTEIDFEELEKRERRKLFVGMTRASMALEMVLSSRAASCMAGLIG